jgi:hypothetical protein
LVDATRPSEDADEYDKPNCGTRPPAVSGTSIGYDQVNPPVAPDVPHVDDGASEVADQSPAAPDEPGVDAVVALNADDVAPSAALDSAACLSPPDPVDFFDFGAAEVDELGEADADSSGASVAAAPVADSADSAEALSPGTAFVLSLADSFGVGSSCEAVDDLSSVPDFAVDVAGDIAAGSEAEATVEVAAGAAGGSSPGSGSGSGRRSTSSTTPTMSSSDSTTSASGVTAGASTVVGSGSASWAALNVSSRVSVGSVKTSSVKTPMVVTEA